MRRSGWQAKDTPSSSSRHKGHDEVVGVVGEVPEAIRLIGSVDEVDTVEVDDPDRVAYLTQTTLSVVDANKIVDRLRQRFPTIVGPKKNDICYATQNRQEAVMQLAREADFGLVVGSRNSSNSRRLAELFETCGVPASLTDRWAKRNRPASICRHRDSGHHRRSECPGKRGTGMRRFATVSFQRLAGNPDDLCRGFTLRAAEGVAGGRLKSELQCLAVGQRPSSLSAAIKTRRTLSDG